MLIVHEVGLLLGLRRNRNQRSSSRLNLRGNIVHRFHLTYAEWTPASSNEADYKPASCEQIGGRNALTIMIRQSKRRSLCAHPERSCRKSLRLQRRDSPLMNSLYIRGNVLGDRLLALRKNFPQRSQVAIRTRFLE